MNCIVDGKENDKFDLGVKELTPYMSSSVIYTDPLQHGVNLFYMIEKQIVVDGGDIIHASVFQCIIRKNH